MTTTSKAGGIQWILERVKLGLEFEDESIVSTFDPSTINLANSDALFFFFSPDGGKLLGSLEPPQANCQRFVYFIRVGEEGKEPLAWDYGVAIGGAVKSMGELLSALYSPFITSPHFYVTKEPDSEVKSKSPVPSSSSPAVPSDAAMMMATSGESSAVTPAATTSRATTAATSAPTGQQWVGLLQWMQAR